MSTLNDPDFLALYINSLTGNFGEHVIEHRYEGYRLTRNGRAVLCVDYQPAEELQKQMEAYILGMKAVLLF